MCSSDLKTKSNLILEVLCSKIANSWLLESNTQFLFAWSQGVEAGGGGATARKKEHIQFSIFFQEVIFSMETLTST